MPISREYLDYIADQLKAFGPVTMKRMFGGAGLYHQGAFFGLVADDSLYFKVDDTNKADYEAAGSGPFKPFGTYAMNYYEVPADVLEDPEELGLWAKKAFATVGTKIKKKAKRKTRKKR
jgi:DNA transformation protein and related proteins